MAKKPTGNRKVEFTAEGVSFTFPSRLPVVGVIKLKPTSPRGEGDFKPKRHIINVLLYDETTKEELTDFGVDGFDLKVEFTARDLAAQGSDERRALDKLDLGYYDETKGDYRWVSCRAQHGYKEVPTLYPKPKGIWVGYAVVNIKEWPDPAMGWGP